MNIEFKRLTDIKKLDIIKLMNNELVRRQMPLLAGEFTEVECDNFIMTKEKHWNKFGFGLWAFSVNDQFIGWGGLQIENEEADLALVLHPNYWGIGKRIYKKIIHKAFNELGIESVIVLFPPTRTRIKGLLRIGFKEDGKLEIDNKLFIRYRLNKTANNN